MKNTDYAGAMMSLTSCCVDDHDKASSSGN